MGAVLVLGLLWLPRAGVADADKLLPERVADGVRQGAVAGYDAETVFEYMNGAAEKYLAYGLQQVSVATYRVGERTITAELYDLGSAPEAFGVFSTSYDGEPVDAMQGAFWEFGELRGWQSSLYLRVRADEDGDEQRRFAVALAEHVASNVDPSDQRPALEAALPMEALQLHRPRYFHREDSFGSFYYLSTQNVLGLDADTDGVFAEREGEGRSLKVILIEYPDAERRDTAFGDVVSKVLLDDAWAGPAGERVADLDPDGFAGVRRCDGPDGQPRLALCFEAADREDCVAALTAIVDAGKEQP